MTTRENLELTRDWQQKALVEEVEHVVKILRRTADEIERELKRCAEGESYRETIRHGVGGEGVFEHLSYEVQHSVTWAVPNMNLDGLPKRAFALDRTLGALEALDPPDDDEDSKLEECPRCGHDPHGEDPCMPVSRMTGRPFEGDPRCDCGQKGKV